MEVVTEEGGWDAEVYATASEPPETIEDWGEPIGEIADADTEAEIPLDTTTENQHFLLWFTTLPPSSEDSSRYRAEVSDIALVE